MSFNSSLFCSLLHFRWITKSSFRASVQTGGCRVLSECIYVFLYIPSVGLMRHHLHIWLFYLNKLWNRFCLVLRGEKPLGFCLFYCNVPECISKMESLRDWGCMCVCVVFKEEGQTSNITPASKSRYHLQMCDGLYIYDLTAIKKKLKTNLFIERFTASSQPCNFFKKSFLSFFFPGKISAVVGHWCAPCDPALYTPSLCSVYLSNINICSSSIKTPSHWLHLSSHTWRFEAEQTNTNAQQQQKWQSDLLKWSITDE